MFRVVHFEIHAEKPERAAKFYKSVFDWDIKKWENDIQGFEYWMVMTEKQNKDSNSKKEEKWQGINGGLILRKGEGPKNRQAVNAYVCTIDVTNIDEYIKKVEIEGGKIVVPKSVIPGVGFLVYCKDTEGNIFGMMQDNPSK